MPAVVYAIPPAGVSAASLWGPAAFADAASPPAILADDIDPMTGELLSLMTYIHPVEASVRWAFRVRIGSGPALADQGQTITAIKKIDRTTPDVVRFECSRIFEAFARRGEARLDELVIESPKTAGRNTVSFFVLWTNLLTGRQGTPVRVL